MRIFVRILKKTFFIILVSTLIFMGCSSDSSQSIDQVDASAVGFFMGISFPPVANNEQRDFTEPLLKELHVSHIRIGENWSLREPSEGNFNWDPLDERINWATTNGIDILLTIQSNGPDWACSDRQNTNSCVYNTNADFQKYIELVLQRYPNKISKIQYGNEWQSDFWYIGNAEQFVAASNIVYDAIQTYSPTTKFVLGGFTTISLRFLAGCNGLVNEFFDDEGNRYDCAFLEENCESPEIQTVKDRIDYVLGNARYDMVDIHLYDDVDQWMAYYTNFKEMVQKPIVITEFGGPNVNIEPSSEQYQSDQLERYLKTIDAMDVAEAYFFKLLEGSNNPAHSESGLIDRLSLTKKMNFLTFKTYATNSNE